MPKWNQESRKKIEKKSSVGNGSIPRESPHPAVTVQCERECVLSDSCVLSNPCLLSDPGVLGNDYQASNNVRRLSEFATTAAHQEQTN